MKYLISLNRRTPIFTHLLARVCAAVLSLGLAVIFLCAPAKASLAANQAQQGYVGSNVCAGCHQQQMEDWQGSHHDLAMQAATEKSVLGDFNNATFEYNGITTTFFKQGDQFKVRTDGEDGKLSEFTVDFVFGVYPLQQLLLPLSRGRLQALSIAWDARDKAEGGQRWYHLYPDDAIDAKDPLHWTGHYQNWNSRCAECHSTDLEKNYDYKSKAYATQYTEINVSCESCHGGGSGHVELVNSATKTELKGDKLKGFPTALDQRGLWQLLPGHRIASRSQTLENNQQIDTCARCHARRGTLGDYQHGKLLSDTHRLALPLQPLYYADGQVLDEDYVYGSFIQSKMHQQGVVCSNCHQPHSLELRAKGNQLCTQCHQAETYDVEQHYHHKKASAGAQCVSCHMPETVYMGVDARRDHSFRVPRPDLSVVIGTPNACNMCHMDKSPDWSLSALRTWGQTFRDTSSHPARAFDFAHSGDDRAVPQLVDLATRGTVAPIWRAAAMSALSQLNPQQSLQVAVKLLQSENALERTAAAESLLGMPLQQRFSALSPLMNDPVTGVRIAVARALASIGPEQLPEPYKTQLAALFKEYRAILMRHSDMPESLVQRALFEVDQRDYAAAEQHYREAIRINPILLPARLNLADLLRATERDDEAKAQLLDTLEIVPENGNVLHALGLLEARAKNKAAALDYLSRSAKVETAGTRHRFVYAIALHDLGEPKQAVDELKALLRAAPKNEQVLLALVDYSIALGRRQEALGYARQLVAIAPQNQQYQARLQSLSGTFSPLRN